MTSYFQESLGLPEAVFVGGTVGTILRVTFVLDDTQTKISLSRLGAIFFCVRDIAAS